MTISGGQISRLENAKPSKFGTPSRIFLDCPGGRAKSIEAMRFIYEQGKHHKKKNLGQENPFCYPLLTPPYPTAGRSS